MIKRILSMALCAALVSASFIGSGAPVFAADPDLTATMGTYYFDTHETGMDYTDVYIYDDELLKGDSKEFNQKLATMTFELAVASMSSEREPKTDAGYANKSRNLRAYLEDNGFVDFEANKYYKERMTTKSMGAACAHKKIVDNGKEYTVLAIVPRSAGYEAEWGGNFVMSESSGDNGDSAGFKNGKNIVLNHAKEYIEKYGITGDIKVWTAGYSRGAGVTNQVGAALVNRPNYYLGDSVTLDPSNLYCYTFGTPRSASTEAGTEGNYSDSKFDYIHNCFETYDVVTSLPPENYGFGRYGKNYTYAVDANKQRMLDYLSETNPVVYDLYMNGGDPDGFTPMKIDITALLVNREVKLTSDSDSYLPDNQRDFLELFQNSMAEASRTADTRKSARTNYYENYQDAMEHVCGYYFSHLAVGSELIDGIKGSKYAPALLAMMYVSHMTDRYRDTRFDDKTKEEIQNALDKLTELLQEMVDSGEDVPQELIAEYAKLVIELRRATRWGDINNNAQTVTALLYSQVAGEGLRAAGLDKENPELYEQITSIKESKAMSRLLGYVFLYDELQTQKVISFTVVTQQMKHMATLLGNSSRYMRPHNNEVILSWLRTLDSSYGDAEKKTAAQISGYRRAYISQPEGVNVTAAVKDEGGNTLAVVENGALKSRSDSWIGVTTSDNGNWLRLPVDKTYKIEVSCDKAASLDLKASEFDTYEGAEVRTVTSDEKYDWKGLDFKEGETVTWVISAVPAGSGGDYKLASDAHYYIQRSDDPEPSPEPKPAPDDGKDKTSAAAPVIVAKAVSKGKTKAAISWNRVNGADRYVIYFSKCNTKKKTISLKKIKTVPASKLKWVKKKLKKNSKYKFRVEAQKKTGGKYVTIAKSRVGHFATGNRSGKFTNPKSLKLSQNSLVLSKGGSAVIKGKIKKKKSGKKLINHEARLRFISDNTGVAKVDSKGRVTAVAAGSCRIYVQAVNGMWKTVSVTVR